MSAAGHVRRLATQRARQHRGFGQVLVEDAVARVKAVALERMWALNHESDAGADGPLGRALGRKALWRETGGSEGGQYSWKYYFCLPRTDVRRGGSSGCSGSIATLGQLGSTLTT